MRSQQLTDHTGRTRRRSAVTAWTSAVAAAVILFAVAACGQPGTEGDRQDAGDSIAGEAGTPYLPNELVDAPDEPPRLSLITGLGRIEPRRIAVDWSFRGGPLTEPSGRIEWPTARVDAAESRAEFEFGTTQIPSRVVFYEYPRVGDDGVPDVSSGTETLCAFANPAAKCWRKGDGVEDARVVVPFDSADGAYWVIHAAWPILTGRASRDDVDVVSASWVVKIDRR